MRIRNHAYYHPARGFLAIACALIVAALGLTVRPGPCALAEAGDDSALAVRYSGDYEYIARANGTAEITAYLGDAEAVDIPATLDGLAVTRIEETAFGSGPTSIALPDSVTELAANPFPYCDALRDVRVSAQHPTLAVIEGVLFSKADRRLVCYPCARYGERYLVPKGIETIGNLAFAYCENLAEVVLPDSVARLEYRAFYNSTYLESVRLPDGLTDIADEAFAWCAGLTSIALPRNVTCLGTLTFYMCDRLQLVSLPDGLKSIGPMCFYSCSSLRELALPLSLTDIADDAFYGCANLTLRVPRSSWAEAYCLENSLPFALADDYDWLEDSEPRPLDLLPLLPLIPEAYRDSPADAEPRSDAYASDTRPDLYGPGTDQPTWSPYHERFLDDDSWYEAIVPKQSAPVFADPDESSAVLTVLPYRAWPQTYDYDEQFCYIRYNEYEGFVLCDDLDSQGLIAKYLDFVDEIGLGRIANCPGGAPLLPVPNGRFDADAMVPEGAVVMAYSFNPDFFYCETDLGYGYVACEYVDIPGWEPPVSTQNSEMD